jgi:hypothetical protein
MSSHEYPIAMPVRSARAGSSPLNRAKSVALEAAQTCTEIGRNAVDHGKMHPATCKRVMAREETWTDEGHVHRLLWPPLMHEVLRAAEAPISSLPIQRGSRPGR